MRTKASLYTWQKAYMTYVLNAFTFLRCAFGATDYTRFDALTEALESWRANFTTTPTAPGRNPSRIHVCPECGSVNLIEDFDQGETICQDCGLVLSQNLMSRGPEWRAFTKEEKDERGRVGIPTSF